ncbi:hypothetical protein [Flavobacterium phragmitis]|uniref:Uncharacterized protein n=1 Tax=Flavobacterium phragmitis TaxID=739143 RepID=A0A1I1TUD6_9FLAO|nr:hypothetical protein [Flavobacterium phragmitis]SFD62124.1 hypothetical protein SAMN05216297_11016 [Flavobacterium phragmitis]
MKNSIEKDIQNLTTQLLELARLKCWNFISNNVVFLLSNISEIEGENFFTQRINRNKLNKSKTPKSFSEAITDFKEIYDLIYDINLHIYKAEKNQTIIDIRYFLKNNLDPDYLKTVINNPSMLHCKIALPPYRKNDDDKFDVNWELGGISYQWNMFWYKRKLKKWSQTRR